MSDPYKEPSYFVYTSSNPYNWSLDAHPSDLSSYLKLFQGVSSEKIIGDSSPYHMYCEHCARDIYQFNKDAKVMCILRNPVERAYSMYIYWHQANYQKHRISHHDFLQSFLGDTLFTKFSTPERSNVKGIYWLRDMGYYARQLERYYEYFPEKQILATRYEDLQRNPQDYLRRVFTFLEIDPAFKVSSVDPVNVTVEPRFRSLYNWLNLNTSSQFREFFKQNLGKFKLAKSARDLVNKLNQRQKSLKNSFPPELHNELMEFYREDLQRLSLLTGLNFDSWYKGQK